MTDLGVGGRILQSWGVGRQPRKEPCFSVRKLETEFSTSKINDSEDLENPKDKFPNEKDKKPAV